MDFSHSTSGHLDNQRCTVLFKNLLLKENPFPAVASLYRTPFMRRIWLPRSLSSFIKLKIPLLSLISLLSCENANVAHLHEIHFDTFTYNRIEEDVHFRITFQHALLINSALNSFVTVELLNIKAKYTMDPRIHFLVVTNEDYT